MKQLFTIIYYAGKGCLTFESVDKIIQVKAAEQNSTVAYYSSQGGSNFCICG